MSAGQNTERTVEPQVAHMSKTILSQLLEAETCVSNGISRMHMYQKHIMSVSVTHNTCVGNKHHVCFCEP